MNRYILFLLILPVATFGASRWPRKKIAGGEPTSFEEYMGNTPFIVALEYLSSTKCTATAIKPYWAVTSGWCVDDMNLDDFYMYAGYILQGYIVEYDVVQIIQHPGYNGWGKEYDIALLQASKPFIDYASIVPANVGDIVTFYGYGGTSIGIPSILLMKMDVEVIDHSTCSNSFDPPRPVYASQICTGVLNPGDGPCPADFGGPLIKVTSSMFGSSYDIVGLFSFPILCGEQVQPILYTSMDSFRIWIEENAV